MTSLRQYSGLLIGTAVGDSVGLVSEGLSPNRIEALWKGKWEQRFVFGHGIVSDDTEHAALTALCVAAHPNDVERFRVSLGRKLRCWFACLPPGVGLATARACFKLWFGFGTRSGVFSAGNGPSMRAGILGAHFSTNAEQRVAYVKASTELTHTDPKALWAALAVADMVALEATGDSTTTDIEQSLLAISKTVEWRVPMQALFDHLKANKTVADYARSLGLERGVTGYSLHSIPVAIYAWLRHKPDFETALAAALSCGGDTDSVGAIVGAIGGATCGEEAIPARWKSRIADWPFGTSNLRKIAEIVAGNPKRFVVVWPLVLVRNMVALALVLCHGFRRLLPPYAPRIKQARVSNAD